MLRIDPKLLSELERWAADELRSANGQIEYLLREVVTKRKGEQGGLKKEEGRKKRDG